MDSSYDLKKEIVGRKEETIPYILDLTASLPQTIYLFS